MSRILTHTLCISLCLTVSLCLIALPVTPRGSSQALLYLMLLPFGALCPLLSGGCLLHDRLERQGKKAARLIASAGVVFFWACVCLLLWLRLS